MESTSDIFTLLQTSDELKELWKKIYLIHQKTKNYLLTAEEVSEDGVALIQPLKEHRDAYDHVIRIFASTGRNVPADYDYYSYVKGNLEKAYGHEYRAFFDTADWLSFSLRKNLRQRIQRIPFEKREALVPDYTGTVALLNQYPFEVSKARNEKDIVNKGTDDTIERYEKILQQLISLYQNIRTI